MKRVLLIVRAAIGLAAVASAAACDMPQVSANTPTGTASDSAEQVLYGARSVLASNGVRRGELSGDTVSTFDAATRFEFQGFHAMLVDTLGRPRATLSAPKGPTASRPLDSTRRSCDHRGRHVASPARGHGNTAMMPSKTDSRATALRRDSGHPAHLCALFRCQLPRLVQREVPAEVHRLARPLTESSPCASQR
jgi:hypothetical protein